jgi:outer membrane protein assembly factor BamB
MAPMRLIFFSLACAATVTATTLPIGPDDCQGGVCVLLRPSATDLPVKMAAHEGTVVQAFCGAEPRLKGLRAAIHKAGCYGRVSAQILPPKGLPHADNLVNLLVAENLPVDIRRGIDLGEIHRVLAPLGRAVIVDPEKKFEAAAKQVGFTGINRDGDILRIQKPWPAEIDQWTHYLHGPDGNPVANDTVVGPPRRFQWLAGPVWAQSHESDSNFRNLVTANGRLYFIVNGAPTSLAGPESPPDKWSLTARDAFNGMQLWQIPVEKWGWREWKPSWFTPRPGVIPLNLDKRIVAVDDLLYFTLGYRAPVSKIDGRTGRVLATFKGTEHTTEILHLDDTLFLTRVHDGRATVARIDAGSGELRWTSEKDYGGTVTDYYRFTAGGGKVEPAEVDATLNIATDGDAVALLDGDSVVCLDAKTGGERWRSTFPLVDKDHNAGRIQAENRLWVGTLIVKDGVVLHASPNKLAAFDTRSGDLLWEQPKAYLQHLWYEWKDVFVIDSLVWTWSSELVREKLEGGPGSSTWPATANGYELKTGKLARKVDLGKIFKTHHHHRCYRNKATVNYIIASRRGSEFVDLHNGRHTVDNWVRGTCHMGMLPANGLQYAPPHPCQCYNDEKLNGLNALAPAGPVTTPSEAPRLAKGPAFGTKGDPQPVTPNNWPGFRSTPTRSGFVRTLLPDELRQLWRVDTGGKNGAPIMVGPTVYVPLTDQHSVLALAAANGKTRWRFTAGGRIDSPPTFHNGCLLFGSADGHVYCVRASDGQLAWKFRAAPEERLIGAFGQLESAWPVHGSVMVHQGRAIFAAGRSSQLDGGLRLYSVDATSGAVRAERTIEGPHYTVDNIEENYRLPMGLRTDILHREGSTLFMRGIPFDPETLEQAKGKSQLKVSGGFLDDAYFKRMPWNFGKSGFARLLVNDNQHTYSLRMFDSLQGLSPHVFFTPGKQGYLLYAANPKTGRKPWEKRVPVRGRAMVVTNQRLCLAGPPDVVDPDDPLAAFEGRMGGLLKVFDKASGEELGEHELPSPPVFHGMAAATKRVVLSLRDGSVVCYGP